MGALGKILRSGWAFSCGFFHGVGLGLGYIYRESWIFGRYLHGFKEFIMLQLIGYLSGVIHVLYIHIDILIYSIELVIWVIWVS